ncbi:hypothetical protein [Marinobacterium mangrovicola]|uniref:hypothetical protein n=1 Tax=Marinobacterium mangrovicola TaxID=1476959 RepID=UPI00104F2894|nr:hypothetical protein [Marinobacterium mangrovicola]
MNKYDAPLQTAGIVPESMLLGSEHLEYIEQARNTQSAYGKDATVLSYQLEQCQAPDSRFAGSLDFSPSAVTHL